MADGTDINLRLTWDDPKSGELVEKTYSLPLTIGRENDNDVIIMSTSVSRQHAKIVLDEERIMITDLQSSNGTYINGSRIERGYLKDGDELIVGEIRVKVSFTKERRANSRPSMDHLYGALSEGEAQPTITIKSIKGRSGLFAEIGKTEEKPKEEAPASPEPEDRLSGDELKAFISRRLQKDVHQDIAPDVDKMASNFERRPQENGDFSEPAPSTSKVESPFRKDDPPQDEKPKESSGIMGIIRRLFGG